MLGLCGRARLARELQSDTLVSDITLFGLRFLYLRDLHIILTRYLPLLFASMLERFSISYHVYAVV